MRMLQFVLFVASLLFAQKRPRRRSTGSFPHYDDAAPGAPDCDRLRPT